MALVPQPIPQTPAPPDEGASFKTFSGLKNTVGPESLTARELSRAQNVDLDDLGQIHRRRGRTQVAAGNWSAIFTTRAPVRTFGVRDGDLVEVLPDYSVRLIAAGVGIGPMAWVQVGATLYLNSTRYAAKLDYAAGVVDTWAGPAGPADFWYSPVTDPEPTLGQVGGRLFGAPPLGKFLTYHNGRIYIAAGSVLWATELFLYDFVDKTKGFRQFESDITGLCGVEDGVYVGTQEALYFLSGVFTEHTRTVREPVGVIAGTMVQAPGELVDPEGRRFPDLPRQTSKAMACMTTAGVVVGLPGGQTYNLTRNQFVFPRAVAGAAMLRQEDGMNTMVVPLHSGGTPTDNARFGDYLDIKIIRGPGTPGQPGSSTSIEPTV